MKKFLTLIIVFAFTALLAGCNDIKPNTNETTPYPVETSIPTESVESDTTETAAPETTAPETDSPETDIPETPASETEPTPETDVPVLVDPADAVTVLSNPGGMKFNNINIPEADKKAIFSFNDRYIIVVTANNTQNKDNNGTYLVKDLMLYLIDIEDGKMVGYRNLSGQYFPWGQQYTDDGIILYSSIRFDTGWELESAYLVTLDINGINVTETQFEEFPRYTSRIVSPDGQYIVYAVDDDLDEHGGIDIVYPDGSRKRVMEDLPFSEYGLQGCEYFTPQQFIDNTRFIYSSTTSIGLYDISTCNDTTLALNGDYMGYADGYIYYSLSKGYFQSELWKCDTSGEKTFIASLDENAEVPQLNDSNTYYFRDGKWFEYHGVSANSSTRTENGDFAKVTVYSEDMTEELAVLEYTFDSGLWHQTLFAFDNTINVIAYGDYELSPNYVTVLSNPGGLDVNTVVIPAQIYNHNAYAECIKYDDRYVLCLTHNYHYDEEARKSTRSNFHLYAVDTANGTIIYSQSLDCTGTPHELVYTSDGRAVLADMRRINDGPLTAMCAHAIEISDGVVTLTDTDIDYFPHYENKVTSTDEKYTAYSVIDDTYGHGGIELHRIDGSVKRIRENYVVLSGENISSDVYGCLKSYSPVGFLDAKHLVIYVGHYESAGTYEIYNVETGETISRDQPDFITGDDGGEYFIRYNPMAVIDGWLYLSHHEQRIEGNPLERCGVSKIDLGGNLVKIAHKYDKEGVFALPNELVWLNNGGSTWEMYENVYNHYSKESNEYFESMDYRIKKTIYSADFELLLEIEYPFFYGSQMEDVYTYGNSCTVITFADGYPLE